MFTCCHPALGVDAQVALSLRLLCGLTTAEVYAGEVYVQPTELIDLGDRFVILAEAPMRAQASGVPLTEAWALVGTVRDGRVMSYQEYFDHAEALEAVGLSG